jgi:membrane-associated protease RseP (regulator of RpoE activity)
VSFGIFWFVVAIVVIIMIHEAGHLYFAKRYGFKATKFFMGFGPTLWSTQRGETEYGVKALPLGGFVKIVGMNPYEEVAPADQPRSYPNKPRWQRALMILGGPMTHWIVAFLLLIFILTVVGVPTDDPTTTIEGISTRSPALDAGFEPDDRIVAAGGQEVESWAEVSRFIKSHPGDTVQFTVVRDDARRTIDVQLGRAILDEDGRPVAYARPGEDLRSLRPGESYGGFLGIAPAPAYERENLLTAIPEAGQLTAQATVGATQSIYYFFDRKIFGGELLQSLGDRGERGLDEPIGLVGVGRIAGETAARGQWAEFLQLIVGLTIIIGIMNLLPLPPLDGGHLAVLAYEALTKRTVDMRKLIPISAAVVSFFLILFFTILYLDITRPVNPF